MEARCVLVTSVGGNVGQGVVKALRAATLPFRIVGVDMEPLSAGFSFVDAHEVVPRSGAGGFIDRMQEICTTHKVTAVFVCSDAEIRYFATRREKLEHELGCPILVNPPHVVQIGNDKLRTACFLADSGRPYPFTVLASDHEGVQQLIEQHGWPVVLKPREGASAKNVFVVDSLIQLAAARTLIPDMVAQQYLSASEGEFTAGTVSDSQGRVCASIILRRDLLQGTTYRTELVQNDELTAQVVQIVAALGAVGPCNVQFRMKHGRVIPFEINPRFSGTSGVRYLYGLNDVELIYRALCVHERIEQPTLKPGVVLRYWDEVHLPEATFDDIRTARRSARGCVASSASTDPAAV